MGHRFIAPSVPDVRDRHHFEIQRTGVLHERWDESVPHAIGEAYHAHTHTIVRASDTCVTLRGKTERCAGQTKPSRFQKLPARSYVLRHKFFHLSTTTVLQRRAVVLSFLPNFAG